MPAYNAGKYIREAVASILVQTYRNFELIIIDDGSTDNTAEIIADFTDNRIRYFKNEKNMGNNLSRNRGMQLAEGEYIAVADADDVSFQSRLMYQFGFMEENATVDILSTALVEFGEGKERILRFPQQHEDIVAHLIFKNKIAQPSVFIRRDSLLKNDLFYDSVWENMGDYDLWLRAAKAGLKFHNISAPFVKYRRTQEQISTSKIDDRDAKLKKHLQLRLTEMNIEVSAGELDLFHRFMRNRIRLSLKEVKTIIRLLNLAKKNGVDIYVTWLNPKSFSKVIRYHKMRVLKYFILG